MGLLHATQGKGIFSTFCRQRSSSSETQAVYGAGMVTCLFQDKVWNCGVNVANEGVEISCMQFCMSFAIGPLPNLAEI